MNAVEEIGRKLEERYNRYDGKKVACYMGIPIDKFSKKAIMMILEDVQADMRCEREAHKVSLDVLATPYPEPPSCFFGRVCELVFGGKK